MDLGGLLSVTAIPLIQSEPQGTVLRILYDLLCEHLMAVMEKKPTKGYKLPKPVARKGFTLTLAHMWLLTTPSKEC